MAVNVSSFGKASKYTITNENGFSVKVITDKRLFDEAVKENDVGILFYYWKRGFKFGAHFSTVYFKDEAFKGVNTFKNSKGIDDYGDSIESFIKKQKYFFPALIAISKKERIYDG